MSVFEIVSSGDRRSLVERFNRKSKQQAISELVDIHLTHCTRIERLEAEIEAQRKDAERYRWLSKRERWASVGADFGAGGVYRQHRVCWHTGDNWPQVEGQSMDEAIDAAMVQAVPT